MVRGREGDGGGLRLVMEPGQCEAVARCHRRAGWWINVRHPTIELGWRMGGLTSIAVEDIRGQQETDDE
jgi:hypothetical protein